MAPSKLFCKYWQHDPRKGASLHCSSLDRADRTQALGGRLFATPNHTHIPNHIEVAVAFRFEVNGKNPPSLRVGSRKLDMVRPRPDERRSGEYCARLMRGAAVAEESFGTRARYWQARLDQTEPRREVRAELQFERVW